MKDNPEPYKAIRGCNDSWELRKPTEKQRIAQLESYMDTSYRELNDEMFFWHEGDEVQIILTPEAKMSVRHDLVKFIAEWIDLKMKQMMKRHCHVG